MITEKDIRKIPQYMLEKIKRMDKKAYPTPDGHHRFYTYFTRYHKELCSVTVAVRNKYKNWYCKQVIVHGIHSDKAYLQDIGMTMGYILVGWFREGLTSYAKWYDYDWGNIEDKYFNLGCATLVNKEYILTIPEYKYSAIDKYKDANVLKYLRLYEKYPQAEYLVKAGMSNIAISKLILNKCNKDKKFCKWLIANKKEIKENNFYIQTLFYAYKRNKPLKETQRFLEFKKSFAKKDNFKDLKEEFQKDLDRFLSYLTAQNTDGYCYLDYFKACKYLHLDMTVEKNRYPHDFKRWHDIRIDEYNSAKAEEDKQLKAELYDKFASVADKYQILQRQLQGSYITLIAKSPLDLINEGEKLHHCVGRMGYDQKFAREETLIFFVRTKEQPEVPLVTLEYSLSGHKILQCYADHDSKPDDKIQDYVNNIWLPYANKKIRKITK